MDLTTITMVLTLLASALSVDAVLHPSSVVLEAAVAGPLDKLSVDADTLNTMLTYEVTKICSTPSLLAPPEIRAGANKGVGMAIAESIRLQSLALALQAQFGSRPERIRLTLLTEDGTIKALVSGSGPGGRIRTPPFQEMLVMQPDESLATLVRRAALAGMTKIDPYTTALYLLQEHLGDGDYSAAETLVNAVKRRLPQTPVSLDRSALENLQGIISLFGGRLDEADAWFHRASESDRDNLAAALNVAFVDVHQGRYPEAARRIEALLSVTTSQDKTLLSTAYLTWGVALLGAEDMVGAEQKLRQAVAANPLNPDAYELWSAVQQERGDSADAVRLHAKALETSPSYRLYTEVAALYFRLPLRPTQQLIRSEFNHPDMIRYN